MSEARRTRQSGEGDTTSESRTRSPSDKGGSRKSKIFADQCGAAPSRPRRSTTTVNEGGDGLNQGEPDADNRQRREGSAVPPSPCKENNNRESSVPPSVPEGETTTDSAPQVRASRCPFAPLASASGVQNLMVFAGYAIALYWFSSKKYVWVTRQLLYQYGEGHIVSKGLIALMVPYMFCGTRLGLEFISMLDNLFYLYFRELYVRIQMMLRKVFFGFCNRKSALIFTIPLSTMTALTVWDKVWVRYVCKSFSDRSCTKTWAGLFLYEYRKKVCRDERTRYEICEKLVSYSPMFFLAIFICILGACVFPFINDFLGDCMISKPRSSNDKGTSTEQQEDLLTEDENVGGTEETLVEESS